jgi:hypothetical protein
MLKLKISSVITILLGVISLLWIIYDYIALTNAVYEYGKNLIEPWRIVSIGFIPIILFHISAFVTFYLLFGFLKKQKEILKEYKQLKSGVSKVKAEADNPDKQISNNL